MKNLFDLAQKTAIITCGANASIITGLIAEIAPSFEDYSTKVRLQKD